TGGCYRHDANVTSVSGLEADYDGGKVTVEEAVERVRSAGISTIVYTSPSHTPEKPKWRILAPLSATITGTVEEMRVARAAQMDRLHGIIGGGFDNVSWTLSQSFYFGSVVGKPSIRVELVEGDYID